MKLIKSFLAALTIGAGMCAGTYLIEEGIHTAKDPYKRAKIKKKFKNIKAAILKKEEELD